MFEIKPALEADAIQLSQLARHTFVETFEASNAKEDISLYLETNFSEARQLSEIKDFRRFIEIAWIKDKPVGFFHLYDGEVDPAIEGNKPIELLRLYLDSKYHGLGLGKALMEKSLKLAYSKGFRTVWLGVWEHNLRAQNFYHKWGFTKVGEHKFILGKDAQNDFVLCRSIQLP